MTENLKDFWPIVLATVAVVVWLVRMEAKTMSNDRDIKRLWEQRKEDQEVAKESRDDVKASLSQIHNSLDDIRQILMSPRDK